MRGYAAFRELGIRRGWRERETFWEGYEMTTERDDEDKDRDEVDPGADDPTTDPVLTDEEAGETPEPDEDKDK